MVLSYGTCLTVILNVLMLRGVFGVYHGELIPIFYIPCVLDDLLKR